MILINRKFYVPFSFRVSNSEILWFLYFQIESLYLDCDVICVTRFCNLGIIDLHSGFNKKILTHILECAFITQNHIFSSKIHWKFMEFLVLGFVLDWWPVDKWAGHLVDVAWWPLVGWLVGRWTVVGGWLVGGFKETQSLILITTFWFLIIDFYISNRSYLLLWSRIRLA